jgi:FkbM family methyltransferase
MEILRTGARRCVERLAVTGFARKRVHSVGTIEYIIQRRRIFDEFGIDLVLDVGANVGQFAHNLRLFYKGDLISFEPVSATFHRLAIAASRDPHWKVHQLALGSQTSTQTINVYRQTEMSSLLKANAYCTGHFGEKVATTGQEVVSVRRLDDVLDEVAPDCHRKRIFLKMDTQGYDLEVFKGLGNKLPHVVAIQSEVSVIPIYEGMPHWSEAISVFESAGFGVAGLFPVTFDACRVIEFDCLMVRE